MTQFMREAVPFLLEEVTKVPQKGNIFLEGLIVRVSDALETANMHVAICRSILIDNPKDNYFLDYRKEVEKCAQELQKSLTYLVSTREQIRWMPLEDQ